MKAVLQRVSEARVEIGDACVGAIERGVCVFVGVEPADDDIAAGRLAEKLLGLRIFPDEAKPMNRSVTDIGGGVLIVSQFTLAADTRRGKRPSFTTAAPPEAAETLFNAFVSACEARHPGVATGRFGTAMQVHLVNDGPVTFVLESPPS